MRFAIMSKYGGESHHTISRRLPDGYTYVFPCLNPISARLAEPGAAVSGVQREFLDP